MTDFLSLEAQAQANKSILSKKDYQTLALSSLGGALEFYDFVIFIFFSTVIQKLFFPENDAFLAQLQTLGIFAAGYLARPFGGILMAHYGDKLGRKKMFTFSVLLMALPTLVIGLLPTYNTIGYAAPILLLLMRIFQGAAIGGEMPGAWVFIAEHTPYRYRGFGTGVLTSGITGGILLGSIIAIIVSHTFTEDEIRDYAWRIPFILGGLFGLISVYMRRSLQETPIFKAIKEQRALAKKIPLQVVVSNHKLACLITGILTWGLSTAIVVIILMTPSVILQEIYHIDKTLCLEANCAATLALTIACIFWGWLSDKIGIRAVLLLGWGGLIFVSYYFYATLSDEIAAATLIFKYTLVGFFVGSVTTLPLVATNIFPNNIRYSGLSFSYNSAYAIFGGLTPIVTATWLESSNMGAAYYIIVASCASILTIFIPLTRHSYLPR